jgi:hypothetical protein
MEACVECTVDVMEEVVSDDEKEGERRQGRGSKRKRR